MHGKIHINYRVLQQIMVKFWSKSNLEKLIPKTINSIINRKKIPIYGCGTNIRDWIFVSDHMDALIAILKVNINMIVILLEHVIQFQI